ncbi:MULTISPECIES: flagellar basal body rod protein FlgB [Providencia]|uniref:Flagellar basal body rod protein FlgB n=3 Tax=Providencia TaxID=586 RepID=A0A8I2AM31_9GAMM|nr:MULTISPECIES: flagellar basal body rod protein FlgB [Providencia]MRF66538.1 flagellar basal body rod protein FlgB [Escherichia coli]EFE55157.1 flagellar basal-body rod protein FlgB [Providencia rettgeri DSM 1131]EHZ6872497.1 flagellar basal body rod protein FlgB [Providencia rettgeri]EHZ7765065.1 flagellar basal body rod protein FlgB [Providencia rettgeri]EIJ7168207.1 flagellar basal body rod protein FlgB [Providencia rettgeri]
MIDKLNATFAFQQQALSIREARQTVLASNIANADTPGYQARDIDFNRQLQQAMDKGVVGGKGVTLAVTSKGHIEGRGGKAPNIDLKYRVPYQTSMDGNTVDMDIERSQFADNTLKYQADLTFINSRVKSMLAVLQQG